MTTDQQRREAEAVTAVATTYIKLPAELPQWREWGKTLYLAGASAADARHAEEVESLKDDREKMNHMLRDTGYGQGQIDAYVAQCEEIDGLRAELAAADARYGAEVKRLQDALTFHPMLVSVCSEHVETIAALRADLAAADARHGEEVEALKDDREKMNHMLRDTGYGQGQIDAYIAQCEEIDVLRADLAAARERISLLERDVEVAADMLAEKPMDPALKAVLHNASTAALSERIAALEAENARLRGVQVTEPTHCSCGYCQECVNRAALLAGGGSLAPPA